MRLMLDMCQVGIRAGGWKGMGRVEERNWGKRMVSLRKGRAFLCQLGLAGIELVQATLLIQSEMVF